MNTKTKTSLQDLKKAIENKKMVIQYDCANYDIDGNSLFLTDHKEMMEASILFRQNIIYRWKGSSQMWDGLVIFPKNISYNAVSFDCI